MHSMLFLVAALATALMPTTAHAVTVPAQYGDDPVEEFCRIYCNCSRNRCDDGPGYRLPGWNEDPYDEFTCDSIWCQWYCGPYPRY